MTMPQWNLALEKKTRKKAENLREGVVFGIKV
jgi:hypothetical protein